MKMKATGTLKSHVLLTICSLGLVSGCGVGDLSESQELIIRMFGASVPPDGLQSPDTSSANYDQPRAQNYVFLGAALSSGGQTTELTSDGPRDYRIVDRPQVILNVAIDSFEDNLVFDALDIRFLAQVEGQGKFRSDLSFNLSNSTLRYDQASFQKQPGKDIEVTIQVNWRNTITRDLLDSETSEAMVEPDYQLSLVTE